ncbi:uncharacterized protein LOC132635278 [Lycium barbarum]|uniref:uncharacterized protein LOC132635278 n=1 Tax=Lycium barbarum TaxID=112863 RepID=UPI00293E8162|nr:uncharacterized protein LOC132635278 [Lycium barbarum]
MGLFRRLSGFLGFSRDEGNIAPSSVDAAAQAQNVPRRGFSVPIQVPVERPQFAPILVPCSLLHGGVQGLRWYAKRLRIDEDGDVADEFLVEILRDTPSSTEEHHRQYPKFELKSTKPAKVTSQVLSAAGKIQHRVEHQGRLEWI